MDDALIRVEGKEQGRDTKQEERVWGTKETVRISKICVSCAINTNAHYSEKAVPQRGVALEKGYTKKSKLISLDK